MRHAIILLAAIATPALADNSLSIPAEALADQLPAHTAQDAAPEVQPTPAADRTASDDLSVDLLADDAPTYERAPLGPTPVDRAHPASRGTPSGDRVPIDFEGVDVSGELVKPQGRVCGPCLVEEGRRRDAARRAARTGSQ